MSLGGVILSFAIILVLLAYRAIIEMRLEDRKIERIREESKKDHSEDTWYNETGI